MSSDQHLRAGGGDGGGGKKELVRGGDPYVSTCKEQVGQVHTCIRACNHRFQENSMVGGHTSMEERT